MKKIISIIITLIASFNLSISQFLPDDIYDGETGSNAKIILSNYERLKPEFENFAYKNLKYFINQDPILKSNFFNGDSSNFKKLVLQINPIMKLSSEAKHYKYSENICNYFVFDTINFYCVATFYLDDSLVFYISRGHTSYDDLEQLGCSPGSPPIIKKWCPEKITFLSYFKGTSPECEFSHRVFPHKRTEQFTFFVDGFVVVRCIINNENIIIDPPNNDIVGNTKDTRDIDNPTKYFKRFYNEKYIHEISKKTWSEDYSWWQFWEWF
jgi:hypothetical protein